MAESPGVAMPKPEPPFLSPADLAEPPFRVVRRGYDPAEVGPVLRAAADRIAALEGEIQQLSARADLLEQRGASAQEAAYSRVFRHLVGVVRAADEAADRIRAEAVAEAEAESAAIRDRARWLLIGSRFEADRVLSEARAEADRIRTSPLDAILSPYGLDARALGGLLPGGADASDGAGDGWDVVLHLDLDPLDLEEPVVLPP